MRRSGLIALAAACGLLVLVGMLYPDAKRPEQSLTTFGTGPWGYRAVFDRFDANLVARYDQAPTLTVRWLVTILSVVVTLALSALSWRYFESRLVNLGRRVRYSTNMPNATPVPALAAIAPVQVQ